MAPRMNFHSRLPKLCYLHPEVDRASRPAILKPQPVVLINGPWTRAHGPGWAGISLKPT
jgi:hypothetical protein